MALLVTVIGIALAILLFALASVALTHPNRIRRSVLVPELAEMQTLEMRKRYLLESIKDIQFDKDLNKISAEDFEKLNSKYQMQAARIFKRIDKLQLKLDAQQRIETDLHAVRHQGEQPVLQVNLPCPNCFSTSETQSDYCLNCGTKISETTTSAHLLEEAP
jgi:rRNA maturation endonuclease Nob1